MSSATDPSLSDSQLATLAPAGEARTASAGDAVARHEDGFVLTGDAAGAAYLLETSIPGIFAAGDVRSGSTKRCAAAVGEGSMAVQFVHERLAVQAAGVR
jgi:thioredoxin reductase (NADPH)